MQFGLAPWINDIEYYVLVMENSFVLDWLPLVDIDHCWSVMSDDHGLLIGGPTSINADLCWSVFD